MQERKRGKTEEHVFFLVLGETHFPFYFYFCHLVEDIKLNHSNIDRKQFNVLHFEA